MDAETTRLIIIGGSAIAAKPAAELVKELALRMLGGAASEIGKMIETPFVRMNERRAQRFQAMVNGAADLIAESGAEAHQVPDYLLLPLLTHGSVIDDSDLQAVWAQLLASASVDSTTVSPAFPQILSELSPKDVAVLNDLLKGRELNEYERYGTSVYFEIDRRPFGSTEPIFPDLIARENLIRLGLVRREPPEIELDPRQISKMLTRIANGDHVFPEKLGEERFGGRYSMTALGVAFFAACAGPGRIKFKYQADSRPLFTDDKVGTPPTEGN